jgi:uncharacterized membrane protein
VNPTFRAHCYSNAAEKIRQAEIAMRGRADGEFAEYVLMKANERARSLIWC